MLLSVGYLTNERPNLSILYRNTREHFVRGIPLILPRFIYK